MKVKKETPAESKKSPLRMVHKIKDLMLFTEQIRKIIDSNPVKYIETPLSIKENDSIHSSHYTAIDICAASYRSEL